jgi:hypothetical protein
MSLEEEILRHLGYVAVFISVHVPLFRLDNMMRLLVLFCVVVKSDSLVRQLIFQVYFFFLIPILLVYDLYHFIVFLIFLYHLVKAYQRMHWSVFKLILTDFKHAFISLLLLNLPLKHPVFPLII